MGEKYKLEIKNGNVHLFKKGAIFDEDCGKLHKTFTGKLKTKNPFALNYELEDISGVFSSGKKYKVIKSNGEEGIMTKCMFGNYYDYEWFDYNIGASETSENVGEYYKERLNRS